LYRLLTPRLKRKGVTIETEIEYRVGPYFVLAVNIDTIDWRKLIRATHRDVALRSERWKKEHEDDKETTSSALRKKLEYVQGLVHTSLFDAIAYTLSFLYHFHWIVYLPVCWVAYNTILGTSIRSFILASVADE
jgi:predicted GTPase